MKYIVIEVFSGSEHMILFGEELTHEQMAMALGRFKIRAAGFVKPMSGQCYGESVSLDTSSRPEDSDLAKKTLGID